MPTYTVKFSNLKISNFQKKNLAKKITNIHNVATGANTYFAQVVFHQIKKNDHFMGGKTVKGKELFVNGQIRAGRTDEVKNNLIIGIRDGVMEILKLPKENVWVYLEDLKPNQMIEYGEILPRSGEEKMWFDKLSPKLKKKLNDLEG